MNYSGLVSFTNFIRAIYGEGFVPLHRPAFEGNEKQYLLDCIESNFVSSVGVLVDEFEKQVASYVGSGYAIATVNGTAALHIAMLLAGVKRDDEVISQALTFVATCNAITYIGARPVFVDVDSRTAGMCPEALSSWLHENAEIKHGEVYNCRSGARISACVPMHTFGLPCEIERIIEVCDEWGIPVVEDAAESLGSFVESRHTGTFGKLGTLSFNGNKIITTGGGGMIVTDDEGLAARAKHITTTAKIPHAYEFVHDEVGYNYRMPNLNAALGCAQFERLPAMIHIKTEIAHKYERFCAEQGVRFLSAPAGTTPNYWLNAIVLDSLAERKEFLEFTNSKGVMTRPAWKLMSTLKMYNHCDSDNLDTSKWFGERLVNLPSSIPSAEFSRLALD